MNLGVADRTIMFSWLVASRGGATTPRQGISSSARSGEHGALRPRSLLLRQLAPEHQLANRTLSQSL